MNRVQKKAILEDLNKKMVLIVGPRQSGKTWLAQDIAKQFERSVYLNYDDADHRQQMIAQDWLDSTDLLVLDELHKMPQWKNYLKGLYDTKPEHLKILVTGSARLDAYKQSGDSLAGRYFVHHLLPFSLAELSQLEAPLDLNKLVLRSGFPEPYFASSDVDAERWRQEYMTSLITVDVLDFENITHLSQMKTLLALLRSRVGSPISYRRLAQDLAISPVTVKKYIHILESLYIVFRLTPFSTNIARSILKEPKVYFFDTGLVQGDEGAKFENLVAVSLLKAQYAQRDYLAKQASLHYLRTKEQREVDFVITHEGRVEQMVEAKLSSADIDKSLYAFHDKYAFPAVQVVWRLKLARQQSGIEVVDAMRFLKGLYL